jgi:N-acetylglutamate synthase
MINKKIKIEFKPLLPRDIQRAISFWRSIDGIFLHDNGEDSFNGIKAYLKRNQNFSFLAEFDGEIIGALMAGHDSRRGFIHHLGINPLFRKRGIGKKLLNLSIEQLKKAGIKKCALFVLKNNKPAHSFYKHLGWKKEDIVSVFSKIVTAIP